MSLFNRRPKGIKHFAYSVLKVLAIVLIWRGIWYVLDFFDAAVFGGSHFWTSLASIVIGLAVLYLPERNLDDIV